MKARVSDAVEDYMRHRTIKKRAKTTMQNDKTTLTRLCEVVPSNIFVESITPDHMDLLFERLGETRGSRAQCNDYYTLVAFFRWCANSKRMPRWHDPLINMEAPEWSYEERRRLEVTQFPVLLDAAPTPRDRILFAAGLYLLARSNECVKIKVGDDTKHSRRIRVELSKVRGQNKPRIDNMPVTREFRRELDRWYEYYQSVVGPLEPDYYLIPAMTRPKWTNPPGGGRPVFSAASQTINPLRPFNPKYSNVTSATLAAIGFSGLSEGEGMHTLRRSGARARFDALRSQGYDGALRQVQALLHHKHMSQTEHYIGLTLDILERDEALMDEYMYPQLAPQADVIPLAGRVAQ